MHQTDNKSFVIVYLNKVDFSPSQSFFSKKKKGIVEEKARTRHSKLNLTDLDFVLQKGPRSN